MDLDRLTVSEGRMAPFIGEVKSPDRAVGGVFDAACSRA